MTFVGASASASAGVFSLGIVNLTAHTQVVVKTCMLNPLVRPMTAKTRVVVKSKDAPQWYAKLPVKTSTHTSAKNSLKPQAFVFSHTKEQLHTLTAPRKSSRLSASTKITNIAASTMSANTLLQAKTKSKSTTSSHWSFVARMVVSTLEIVHVKLQLKQKFQILARTFSTSIALALFTPKLTLHASTKIANKTHTTPTMPMLLFATVGITTRSIDKLSVKFGAHAHALVINVGKTYFHAVAQLQAHTFAVSKNKFYASLFIKLFAQTASLLRNVVAMHLVVNLKTRNVVSVKFKPSLLALYKISTKTLSGAKSHTSTHLNFILNTLTRTKIVNISHIHLSATLVAKTSAKIATHLQSYLHSSLMARSRITTFAKTKLNSVADLSGAAIVKAQSSLKQGFAKFVQLLGTTNLMMKSFLRRSAPLPMIEPTVKVVPSTLPFIVELILDD
jgi:hypothetical protein